jgi:flagellar hook-length control protein FliK
VSQVASDPTIHAHKPHLPRLPRPAQPSDQAPSPFESLIDDGSQPAEPAPAPTENKATAADGAQAPAKTSDSKAPVANDAAPASNSDDDASVEKPDYSKSGCDPKLAADAKLADGANDSSKTEGDDKPVDGQKSDKPTVLASPAIVQTTNSTDAIAVTPTPAPVSTPVPVHADQDGGSQQITLIAESGLQLKSPEADTPKTVVAGKNADAGQQAETDQAVDEISDGSQPATKGPQAAHTDKPQFTVSESDKDHVAEARGESAVNGHRGNSDAQAPVTADSSLTATKITADTGIQPTIQTTTTYAASNAAAPATLVSQPGPQAAAIPLAGVALEIASKALAGKNRFEIRLDPPELGRIEVRLDVDRDGNVTSRMTVDRAETLDLLRREATGLERALQDAGLKTTDNSLQFSLRDQSMGQQQTGAGPEAAQLIVTDETLPPIDVIPQNYGRLAGTGGGLDIRV